MKIAVTGATGFIGQHVLKRLSQEPVNITAVGRTPKKWNGIGKFVEMDLAEIPSKPYAELGHPDILLHLAWEGLPNYHSLHHFETELPRHYSFLKSMIMAGLPHLVVVGTCLEYGMQNGPLTEPLTPNPKTSYGFAKNTLRNQLEYLTAKSKSTELTWARLFYLWGEGQAATSIYPTLSAAVARNDKVFEMSSGEQLRDYMSVVNVADYLVRLSLLSQGVGIINVCSGRPISIRKLVEFWLKENEWNIQLNFGSYPYPDYEPMAFWGDAKKLNALMGQDYIA